jgi:hypothetical protein
MGWRDDPEVSDAPAWMRDPEVGAAPTAAPAEQPVTLDGGATMALHLSRHGAFGLGDKITALVQALSEKSHDKTGKSLGQIYDGNLAFNDKLLEDSDKVHPVERWVGNGLGFGVNLAALAGVAPIRAALAAKGLVPAAEASAPVVGALAGLLRGAKEGSRVGALTGLVGGYGSSRSDSLGGALVDTGVGGVAGSLGGALLGGLGGAAFGRSSARTQPRPANSFAQALEQAKTAGQADGLPMMATGVEPIPEAQTLQKYGIPLTLRQMSPEGPLAEISEASERVPFLGRVVQSQEKASQAAWRDAAIRQAMPGEGPMVRGDVADKLGDVKSQISALYDQVAKAPAMIAAEHPETGELVNPVSAFKAILSDPNYQASDSDLRIVHGVLKDQLGKLYRATDGGKSINAGLLMDMRSALRQAAQDAMGQDGGNARAQMFKDAAESLTGGLKGSLSPTALATLQKADAAYSNFSRVANAAQRAANQVGEGEFSPQRLASELAKAYGRKFATDSEAGGSLRELARAGKVVFTPRDVKTGHGEYLKAPLGLALGPLISRANASPATQAAFTAAAQRAAQTGSSAMAPPAAGALESALVRYLSRVPSGALPASALSPEIQALVGALSGNRE